MPVTVMSYNGIVLCPMKILPKKVLGAVELTEAESDVEAELDAGP